MHRLTASICRLVGRCLLVAVGAACSGPIAPPPITGGPGESQSTSGGGDGGGGPIAPAACLPAEAILVAASSSKQTVVAVQSAGTWREEVTLLPASSQAVAYVDYWTNHLAALWIDRTYGIDHTHATETRYGTSFEAHDILGWHPEKTTRILGVTHACLVDRDDSGAGLAIFDSGDHDVHPIDSTLLDATSIAVRSSGYSMLFVGPGAEGELCEHSFSLYSSIWLGPRCHPGIRVGSAGHAPISGPLLAALPSEDVVAVYFPAGTSSTLGATVLHAEDYVGGWSTPVTTTSPSIGLSFAVAATPDGEVIAGVVSLLGEVSALRFTPGRGWSAPVAIDRGVSPTQRISVAPGICGDDALIAYATSGSDGEIKVARVRGDQAETTTVARLTDDAPIELSIATRSSDRSPSP